MQFETEIHLEKKTAPKAMEANLNDLKEMRQERGISKTCQVGTGEQQ